jgi:hypothetical protein
MRAPAIFIIIPCMEGKMHYIRPYDIINMCETPEGVSVGFKLNERLVYLITLLTAQEIHEKIIELEEANFKYTFGE